MQIDWFTFVAQIINFGILVWLLNRFLYGPITEAIAARESAIAARMKAADDRFDDASSRQQEYERRNEKLDSEVQTLREQNHAACDQQRLEMLRDARESVDQQRIQWQNALETQQASAEREIKTETASKALDVARKALTELAGVDLDRQIATTLSSQLDEIDKATLADVRATMSSAPSAVVTSANLLSAEVADEITRAIKRTFDSVSDVGFEQDSDLIGGIRIRLGAHELGWNIADYFDAVAVQFDSKLAEVDT
ncbi:MAG: F0F1 ATP synthase subunit delta [Planctomycetaceae bacterium]